MTIDGFIFDVNEYGMQTFTYDADKATLQLPIVYMETEMVKAEALMKEVETNNPISNTIDFSPNGSTVSRYHCQHTAQNGYKGSVCGRL